MRKPEGEIRRKILSAMCSFAFYGLIPTLSTMEDYVTFVKGGEENKNSADVVAEWFTAIQHIR